MTSYKLDFGMKLKLSFEKYFLAAKYENVPSGPK